MIRKLKIVAAVIGTIFLGFIIFSAGAYFGDPKICCVHPIAEQTSLLEFVATWIGPVVGLVASITALAIALNSERNSDRRFKEQIERQAELEKAVNDRFERQIFEQIKLDKKADERQQAEWTKREESAAKEKNQIASELAQAFRNEFEMNLSGMLNAIDELERDAFPLETIKLGLANSRVIFNAVKKNPAALNSNMLTAISIAEHDYSESYEELKITIANSVDPEQLKRDILSHLRWTAAYLWHLSGEHIIKDRIPVCDVLLKHSELEKLPKSVIDHFE